LNAAPPADVPDASVPPAAAVRGARRILFLSVADFAKKRLRASHGARDCISLDFSHLRVKTG
jgi:hypothetical protein